MTTDDGVVAENTVVVGVVVAGEARVMVEGI